MLFSQTSIGFDVLSFLVSVSCSLCYVLNLCFIVAHAKIYNKKWVQRDGLLELGASCIHFLNVVSRIWTSTEERSHCCISSNTSNASSSTSRWRQMGLRDQSTLRESRVVSASSTHFFHHALGIGIGASIVVLSRRS